MRKILLISIMLSLAPLSLAGNLNPPSAPVSGTMKTLSEIETRIPISQSDFPTSDGVIGKYILNSGSYYLTQNIVITTKHTAITISADDVVLDLNGFTISSTNTDNYNGISINSGDNVVIKNGSIIAFGGFGVYSSFSSHNCVLENLEIKSISHDPIKLYSSVNTVKRCRIVDNADSYDSSFYCIYSPGGDSKIIDNLISGNGNHSSGTSTYGIYVGFNSTVEGNIVVNNFESTTSSYVRALSAGNNCRIKNNIISSNLDSGAADTSESRCVIGGDGCIASGNIVSGNGANMETNVLYAMQLGGGSTAKANVIVSNGDSANVSNYVFGLKTNESTVVDNFLLYNGANFTGGGVRYGFYTDYRCLIKDNFIISNGTGIYQGTGGCVLVDNCYN